MCRFKFLIITSLLILTLIFSTSKVWGTNESSYQSGYMSGSLQSPDISRNDANYFPQLHDYTCRLANASVIGNGAILPAVTNQTACENGFYDGWKVWCIHNAVNCVGNMTLGYLPDLLLKTHEQYQKGYTISNGTYNQCPIGENNAYCIGWYDNIGDRAGECGDNPNNGTFASHNLNGCPLDIMTSDQMAKPKAMIGTWDYVNGTISGKIVYSDYGNFTLKIPNKTAFGDYKLEGSWGSLGPNILTLCYAYASCLNNTLTAITPNHITFRDSHGHMIHLMKPMSSENQSIRPETGVISKASKAKLADTNNTYNSLSLLGTWSINNQSKSTITFDNFIKYAHWKYSQYCCDVNIQKFVVNLGHKIFEGYWNATLYINSPMYYIHSPKYLLPMFPSSIGLCTFNIQDHGEYHENISNIWSSPLSGCTKMTVYVIDSNHLNLHSPSSVMYLTRESG